MLQDLKLKCFWTIEHWRGDTLLRRSVHRNAVTALGKNHILDVQFETVAKEAAWYLGLVDGDGYELLEESDTMLVHPGWVEFTDYSELTRPQWLPDPAVNGLSINSLVIDFNITADGSVRGGLLTSDEVIGATAGLLWGTALFEEEMVVENLDVIKALYGIQAG
jgi:hypothetical protein